MQRERDGWRVKKGAGRGCLLNHITVKGIALTLSPLCALSTPTNLLIDRRSSQTAPSSPPARAPKVPWVCLCGPTGCHPEPPTTTDYSGCRLTRICHVDLKTTCSGCEYIMKQGGNRLSSVSVSLDVLHLQLPRRFRRSSFGQDYSNQIIDCSIWVQSTQHRLRLYNPYSK